MPWFEARDASIALAPSGAKRKAAIKALQSSETPLAKLYDHATKRMAMAAKVAKGKAIYSTLNKGKLNIYKLFVERSHSLVHPTGMVGLLTPSGIAGDLSSSEFFRRLSTGGHIKSLFDFENRRTRHSLEAFFPDVDSRFKFAAMMASPKRTFEKSNCGFFLQGVSEIDDTEKVFPLSAEDFARVNPNTGTAPIFRSRRDMEITRRVYENAPALIDRSSGSPVATWDVEYAQMLNVTSHSHLFRTQVELEETEGAWSVGNGRWQSAAGEWLPLYEGKMVQAMNHRAADVIVNPDNLKRPAQPLEATPEQLARPDWLPRPQFWVKRTDHPLIALNWTVGYKIISSPTNARTMIGAILPQSGVGNSMGIMVPTDASEPFAPVAALLVANLNSVSLDFVLRQKIQGQNINWFITEQLPFIPPAVYTRVFGPKSAAEVVREAVLELTYTAHDMAAFARDMGHVDADGEVLPPFAWDDERRLQLRAKLDALYFILYGIYDPENAAQSREDIRYIYSTFPIVERQEIAEWGSYRSRDLALAWINALMAGQPDAEVAG